MNRRKFLCDFVGIATLLSSSTQAKSKNRFPDLMVYTEEGDITLLNRYYKDRLLLNIWNSSCNPCIEDIPILNSITLPIDILGLYLTSEKDPKGIKEIKKTTPIGFPNVILPYESYDILAEKYGSGMPKFFLVDKSGYLIHHQDGGLNYKYNLRKLEKAIRKNI